MKINLVALPTLEIPDQPARLRLESLGIYLVNLDEKDPFKLDPFPALRSPAERPLVVTLTPDQEADFPINPTSLVYYEFNPRDSKIKYTRGG